jgi:hypothetical protein
MGNGEWGMRNGEYESKAVSGQPSAVSLLVRTLTRKPTADSRSLIAILLPYLRLGTLRSRLRGLRFAGGRGRGGSRRA